MRSATARNLHVPLPARLYDELKAEAVRQKRPATHIAREAIARSLLEQRRARTEKALRAYVRAVAGTAHDLDDELERAAALHLLEAVPWR